MVTTSEIVELVLEGEENAALNELAMAIACSSEILLQELACKEELFMTISSLEQFAKKKPAKIKKMYFFILEMSFCKNKDKLSLYQGLYHYVQPSLTMFNYCFVL